ncbi:S8 family serine peptidase [Bradyrhizobium sp. Pear77]|uniref:S8 family peptidase n=1 Tax=Bradyrhizobium altum TaxID=1571202 RepID=UPI001E28857D|nr:S8 family serine peptidase [Bradyrhizobium altum]MCC8958753.1 S8 family serine peptidase [Bradyrhizobium altum]
MRKILLAFATLLLPTAGVCQQKIENGVRAELNTAPLVRVLIVTRPDPEQTNGGASFASASSYISDALSDSAKNVRPIGSLPVAAAEISAAALPRLREDPNVVLVTRDIPMPPTLMDSVPFIGGDKMHGLGYSGTNETVAVLDTGAQVDHPALAGAIVGEACFSTDHSNVYNVKSLCPGGFDVGTVAGSAGQCPTDVVGCDHGTHVAGIIAGHNMKFAAKNFGGVAPAAKLLLIQVYSLFDDPAVCKAAGKCIRSFTSDQLRALEYVLKHRAEFSVATVNMSLGSGYFDAACDKSSALTEIIERLRSKGIPTVVSAGNEHFFDGVAEPACISSAVSVAATKKDGSLDVSYSNVASMVHIAAPGTDIVSSVPGSAYATMKGTSMAAPHVAAALALLRQEFPGESVSQLESRLTSGAPITVDVRTGTKLPRLELVHQAAANSSSTGSSPATSSSSMESTPTPDTAPSSPASGTFILKTARPTADIEWALDNNCGNLKCDLKPIGEDTFKLDVTPKPSVAPQDKAKIMTIDTSTVKGLLKDIPSVAVFDNRLSSPFTK